MRLARVMRALKWKRWIDGKLVAEVLGSWHQVAKSRSEASRCTGTSAG